MTEGTAHYSPFLLHTDTFGKLLRCLTNVCNVKLKKLRYLNKLRLSESDQAPGVNKKPFNKEKCLLGRNSNK